MAPTKSVLMCGGIGSSYIVNIKHVQSGAMPIGFNTGKGEKLSSIQASSKCFTYSGPLIPAPLTSVLSPPSGIIATNIEYKFICKMYRYVSSPYNKMLQINS